MLELPLIITPTDAGSPLGLIQWLEARTEERQQLLLKHGALLFRGFRLETVEQCEAVAMTLAHELKRYVDGSSPRTGVKGSLYTSTEYPSSERISLHNELSYSHYFPSTLYFFCLQAAPQGGETPLIDSRRIISELPSRLTTRFIEKGVRYTRNLRSAETKGLGLSWQQVFEADDKATVERYCREGGIEFEWQNGNRLRTSQLRPAVARHRETGESVWFNQADQFHWSNIGLETGKAMLEMLGEENLPTNAYYGDGSAIEVSVLEEIRNFCQTHKQIYDWHNGDFLLIDNVLAAHGRMPFKGPRKILVAMS